MEITPYVHSIPAPAALYTGALAPNVYLVQADGQAALVDSGLGDDRSVRARTEYLKRVSQLQARYIVLTHHHFDHASGAHALRRLTGGRVAMHRQEEGFLRDWQREIPHDLPSMADESAAEVRRLREEAARATPDELLEDGDEIRVGGLLLEVVHTPGHTLGSICLYLRRERALFTGDTVLGLGPVAVAPPPFGDMALYLDSLERLKSYDAALLLPGHGPPVSEPLRKIQELIDHRLAREDQVLRLLAEGKATANGLLAAIYPELDRRLLPMARWQIESHLDKLLKEGRVLRPREDEYALS